MIIILVLFILAVGVAVLFLNAWILGLAVPALIQDPSNFWGWIGVLVVLATLFGSFKLTSD